MNKFDNSAYNSQFADTDECKTKNSSCDVATALCYNINGSSKCVCREGYKCAGKNNYLTLPLKHRKAYLPIVFNSLYLRQLQGVSKVRSDFFFAQISLIVKNTFCKT